MSDSMLYRKRKVSMFRVKYDRKPRNGDKLKCKFCLGEFTFYYPSFQWDVVLNCPHCGHGGKLIGAKRRFLDNLPYWDITAESEERGKKNWGPYMGIDGVKHVHYKYLIWKHLKMPELDVEMNGYINRNKEKKKKTMFVEVNKNGS